jgi:hypothetical protein
MTEQELVDLEIERRALLMTAAEMSRGDACIETGLYEMVQGLRKRAAEIGRIIHAEVNKR